VSGSKFDLATSIRAASRNSQRFIYQLADAAVGVAPKEFPKHITLSRIVVLNTCILTIIFKPQKPSTLPIL
jgi:hypothetical protein